VAEYQHSRCDSCQGGQRKELMMRTKEEILSNLTDRFDKAENMQAYLVVEILCDIRDDQIAHNNEMERFAHLRLGM